MGSILPTQQIRRFDLILPTQPVDFVYMCIHEIGQGENGILAETAFNPLEQGRTISIDFSKARSNSAFQIWAFKTNPEDGTAKAVARLAGNAIILKNRVGRSLYLPTL